MTTSDRGVRRRGRVAVIVKGWPRLSETFIAQEILGLERRGLDQMVVSLRHPTDRAVHAINRAVTAPVVYLPEYLHREPGRVLAALARVVGRRRFGRALRAWLADLGRDPSRNRIRRFGQAVVLAAELPPDVAWLHSHFLHTPASVTRYTALMCDLPWSFSAHAKDIWTLPEREKRIKLAEARWGVTCTRYGHAHLAALAPTPDRVELVYHGLDFSRFPAPPARPARDGGDPRDPVTILSVGRAVEKKGFDIVLDALARLPIGLDWRFRHVGGGALLDRLKARAEALGIGGRIEWLGALAQDRVIEEYRRADLFVLASRVAADGDRDGLPNVLMEAQSQALACLSTRAAAIPELILDGETGVLVPPDDAAALADAMTALITDPERRHRLGRAGHDRVTTVFSFEAGLNRLAERFAVEPAPANRDDATPAATA